MQKFLQLLLFFLITNVVFAQDNNGSKSKLSPFINKKSLFTSNDSIDVLVLLNSNDIEILNSKILNHNKNYKTAIIRLKGNAITGLIKNEAIKYIDLYIKPKEELTTGSLDLATNKTNEAHSVFPQINGDSIIASIKENRFDTTDVDLIGRYINSGIASPAYTTHAVIMATTLAGAGNSSPYANGVAHHSYITSSNFANLLPDADTVFIKNNITIQNHSYGTIIQNYYGIEAAAYDANTYNNKKLVHVFSSGNAGLEAATTGRYAGIEGFANLTGNFKHSKNVITVGAIDSFYNIPILSSKGPAFDGRVKPELVAYSADGTSGGAAMVSGAAALIQQAYKHQFNIIPNASLVKAVLLNSADDVGEKFIDYTSGYGSLNTYEAIKTIVNKNFIEGVINKNEVKTFTLNIPANAASIKITIAWTDPPASVDASKALINDIDILLKNTATNEEWKPWVLNSFPHKDSLQLIAQRSIDTLNTVEQISIEQPLPGNYELQVNGNKIINAHQSFSIAYKIDTSGYFEWTFPTKNDNVLTSENNVLRWQTTITQPGNLEYFDGSNWKQIAAVNDLSKGYFKWIAPNDFSTSLLRMNFGTAGIFVSDTFTMSHATNMSVGFSCKDSFMLYWNKLPVNEYQLYKLEGKYLQPLLGVTDTFRIFPQNQNDTYYSVAPVIDGKVGLRSSIINTKTIGATCYFQSFYLKSQGANNAEFNALLGTTYGVKKIDFQKFENGNYITLSTINNPGLTSITFSDNSLVKGINLYRIQLTLNNNEVVYSNLVTVYHFSGSNLIIYPNPARQFEPVKMMTTMAGRMKIEIYNETGALIKNIELKDLVNKVHTFSLAKGIYFLRSTLEDGTTSSQKLIVY